MPARPGRPSGLGWSPSPPPSVGPLPKQGSLGDLARALANALALPNAAVNLYVEAPLFLPGHPSCAKELDLMQMRPFEFREGSPKSWLAAGSPWPQDKAEHPKSWPWYGRAGGATAAMVIPEFAWLLREIKNGVAGTAGQGFIVGTCPCHECSSCELGSGMSMSSPQLIVLEAFCSRETIWLQAACSAVRMKVKPEHVDVADHIVKVADHFGSIPTSNRAITCPCGTTHAGPVWYDTSAFSHKVGTLNVVALAAQIGGAPARCSTASHGWVLCA